MTGPAPYRLGQGPFFLASVGLFAAQHLAVVTIFGLTSRPFFPAWWFWPMPLRALIQLGSGAGWVMLAAMAAVLAVDATLAILALWRARDAGLGGGVAVFVIVPGLQILAILALSLKPGSAASEAAPSLPRRRRPVLAAWAVIVGALLSVAAVAGNAVWLAIYGWTLFLASPFLIGLCVAYIANFDADIGLRRTFVYVLVALMAGAACILLVAFEGIVCLFLASPLIVGTAWIGALLGRNLALAGVRGRQSAVFSVAILPIFYLGEVLLPPQVSFDDTQNIVVEAPPMAVWDAVVHMHRIVDPPAAPFRWGLAYPVGGDFLGKGVGAIRVGYFSTGVAFERVSAWLPGRLLGLNVLSDPPAMRELSPYAHVNAPHVDGYFRTTTTLFAISPLEDGRTRLSVTTHHELDLEPALYWAPLARWAVDANKQRVLSHLRRQAEAASARGGLAEPVKLDNVARSKAARS